MKYWHENCKNSVLRNFRFKVIFLRFLPFSWTFLFFSNLLSLHAEHSVHCVCCIKIVNIAKNIRELRSLTSLASQNTKDDQFIDINHVVLFKKKTIVLIHIFAENLTLRDFGLKRFCLKDLLSPIV